MFFVFDIETIPDIEFVRLALDQPHMPEPELLELAGEELAKNKSGFLPPMFHRMVAWVGLWIDNDGNPRNKQEWHGTDEKEGIQQLINALRVYKDFGLIHHNGRGFDIPLLTYRSLKHGLQLPPRLNTHDIKYRYSQQNIDLVDQFSNFGASSWPKLKHLGLLLGIPFKKTGEGNAVYEMFQQGQLSAIEHYCYEDVIATYLIWLFMKFNNGEFRPDHFEGLRDRALSKLKEIQDTEP